MGDPGGLHEYLFHVHGVLPWALHCVLVTAVICKPCAHVKRVQVVQYFEGPHPAVTGYVPAVVHAAQSGNARLASV